MTVEQYEHHGRLVSVMSDLRGRHRDHCLCYVQCARFHPGESDNCHIAQSLFEFDIANGVTTPVFECAEYDPEPHH